MGLFDAVSGLLGAKDDEALAAQQAGTAQAAAIQKEMYDQSRADLQPWRETGQRALGKMEDADYMRDFTMSDFQADPGYQFRMDEANKALERSAAARGGLMGGGTLRGLATLNQNLASQEYGAAYDRFNADRDRRFGRLSNLAGMGQSSAAQQANNAMSYGSQMGDLYSSMGTAQAANLMAQGNRNVQMGMDAIKGASTFAFCDERLKTDIATVSKEEMAEMKRHLKAFKYAYKDQKHGKGSTYGVMAQDLQKSKLGKTLVFEDASGNLCLDIGKIMVLWLATEAEA